MKIQLENISPDASSSFRILHNPRLNDIFYWHFHPEYELVFIEGANGTRHVGEHISQYEGSDLVLIGSNIPHLNFDYGVQTDYNKEVLHISSSFENKFFHAVPELRQIHELFDASQYGIAFHGATREEVGQRLKGLHLMPPFSQFLEILHIFEILARSEERTMLHDKPYVNRHNYKKQGRLRSIYAYVDQHYHQKISLDEVAAICNLEKASFCRYFKEVTGNTFIGFLNQYRISQAKRMLLNGKNVSEACYSCGFESLSYFNRTFKKLTDENPTAFRKRLSKRPSNI